jgi:hypothetical protein
LGTSNNLAQRAALPRSGGLITGDLEIAGNMTISGTTTTVATETLTVNDNIILINSSLSNTAPPQLLKGGIEVSRGTLSNFQFVFEEATQFFKVGTADDLQAVATRPDTVPAQAIAYWDDTESSLAFNDTVVVTAEGNVGIGTTNPTAKLHAVGTVTATAFTGGGSGLTGFTASQIPSLDAGKITTGTLATARLPSASTSAAGIVQLNNGTTSTSTVQAATANAVKLANDNANNRLSRVVNAWVTSSEGHNRFYFASSSHTYMRSQGNIFFRTGGDVDRLTLNSSGEPRTGDH